MVRNRSWGRTHHVGCSLTQREVGQVQKGRNGFEIEGISLFLSLRLFILFPPSFIGFQYIERCLFPILYIYIIL